MEYVISICIILLLTIIGILFYNGRCSFLISGYNTLTEEQKKEYDEKSLLRFMSYVVFVVEVLIGIAFAGSYFNMEWLSIISAAAVVFLIIASSIYWNTGNRFKIK